MRLSFASLNVVLIVLELVAFLGSARDASCAAGSSCTTSDSLLQKSKGTSLQVMPQDSSSTTYMPPAATGSTGCSMYGPVGTMTCGSTCTMSCAQDPAIAQQGGTAATGSTGCSMYGLVGTMTCGSTCTMPCAQDPAVAQQGGPPNSSSYMPPINSSNMLPDSSWYMAPTTMPTTSSAHMPTIMPTTTMTTTNLFIKVRFEGSYSKTPNRRRNHFTRDDRTIYRPEWQRTLRCKDDTEESCEECSDTFVGESSLEGFGTDCWGAKAGSIETEGEEALAIDDDVSALAPGRWVGYTGTDGHWQRFQNVIHFKCAKSSAEFSTYILKLCHGEFRLILDGQLQLLRQQHDPYPDGRTVLKSTDAFSNHGNGTASCLQKDLVMEKEDRFMESFGSLLTFGSGKSGHELIFEFTPLQVGARMTMQTLVLDLASGFAKCEDTKACLKVFSKHGQSGIQMRNDNCLQLQCLQASAPADINAACVDWRNCLQRTNERHDQRILQMLTAAGLQCEHTSLVSTADRRYPAAVDALNNENDDKNCLHPAKEDPESWDCDCYENALANCQKIKDNPKYTVEACLRASYCNFPQVCKSWSDKQCHSSDMVSLRDALKASKLLQQRTESIAGLTESSLLSRASSREVASRVEGKLADAGQEDALDETLMIKQCA